MATRCPACGEFIGDNTFGKSPQHKCGAVINWNAVELASTDPRDAEIARLNALLAEAREGLRSYHGVLKLMRTNLEFIAQGGNANELIRTYERRAREVCCSMDAELDALAKIGA